MFRFLIVGVLLTLILYPVVIIVGSIICIALILTIWIWMPIIVIIAYLINIFVFEYETDFPDGCLIKSIPLLVIIAKILFSLLKMLFYTLFFFIIAPLCGLFIVIYAIIHTNFRSLTDCIMLCIIRCCGRTPSNNSSIATKISGPGMSRNYYMSINEEDVYILTQAEMERLYMEQFDNIMRKKIN